MTVSLPLGSEKILQGKTVYCGFSGGADSMILLLLLHEAEEVFSFTLKAVHFEHGLRGSESENDSVFAQKFCEERNIPFQMIRLNVPEHLQSGENTESAARRLRMAQWKKIIREPEHEIAVLGHHADDAIENLLLRLMRGSNASGASSLSEYSVNEGVPFFRPLLSFSKNEIMKDLQSRGLVWRTDSSNLESDYGRNFLRNKILPQLFEKFPYAQGGFLRSLQNLSADADFIDRAGEEYYKTMDPWKRESWCGLHPAIFCRVFRLFLTEQTGVPLFSGHNLISRFESMITNPPEKGFQELTVTDLPEYSLFCGKENIILKHNIPVEPILWNWKKNPVISSSGMRFELDLIPFDSFENTPADTVYFSMELPGELMIRNIRQGDKFLPFGKTSEVSPMSILSEQHYPEPLRDIYPVLTAVSGEILWIPGIRRSALHPVKDPGREIIRIKVFTE